MAKGRTETSFSPGAYDAGFPNTPGAPTFVSHTSSSITIDIDENSNSEYVQYAVYSIAHSKYIGADGVPDEASEVWQTAGIWGDIEVTGLSLYTAYTFKVKARNELEEETAFSSDSAVMNCLPELDAGATSTTKNLDVTGGNTKVVNTDDDYPTVSGNAATYDSEGNVESYYGEISVTFKLQSYRSQTGNSITVEFSENGTDWYAATAGTGSCETSDLDASADGTEYTFVWDSYTDAGASELDLSVYIRITPIDSDGAAGTAVSTDAFGVNNRPAQIDWYLHWDDYEGEEELDNPFDKDTTPVYRAIIPSARSGDKLFPQITFYDAADGTTVISDIKSYESIAGWRYESEPDVWHDMTVEGIPASAADGVNQLEITVQAGDALPTGNYVLNGKVYEVRDEG